MLPGERKMRPKQVTLVQQSFAKVAPIADQAAIMFYGRLFELAPEVKAMFPADMTGQRQKLMAALAVVVNGLSNLQLVLPTVGALAKRHVAYGARPEHYPVVGAALLWTLEKGLGEAWTTEVAEAWTAAYATLSSFMIEQAYGRTQSAKEKHLPKAYWIVRVSVHDKEGYSEYLDTARAAFEKYDARFVVRGGMFEAMEGNARDRNVVVEFVDRETALACYRSPEYQAAKSIRQKHAEADFIIVDGAA